MIKTNADDVAKSLEEYKKEVERKLIHMVAGFASEVAESASLATRKGHVSEGGNTKKYLDYYRNRAKPEPVGLGIEAVEGFHKGAWVYSEGNLTFDKTIYPVGQMKSEVEYQAQANYKVGDSFVIGAVGPAFDMLEEEDALIDTALSMIKNAHSSDLHRHYNEG